MPKLASRGTAEHELAQAGMAVAAHHEQISSLGNRLLREVAANIGVLGHALCGTALNAMARQGGTDVGLCRVRRKGGLVRRESDYCNILGLLQMRDCIEHRPGRFPTLIPCNQYSACRCRTQTVVRDHQHWTSAAKHERIVDIQVRGLRPSAILLSHDHKIDRPGRGHYDIGERSAVSILLAPLGDHLRCAACRIKECLSKLRIGLAIGLGLGVSDSHTGVPGIPADTRCTGGETERPIRWASKRPAISTPAPVTRATRRRSLQCTSIVL
jgi:hypothetical protein